MKMLHSILSAALLGLALPAGAAHLVSDANDRTGLSLTLYGDDLALVSDRRRLLLGPATPLVELRAVSSQLRPETLFVEQLAGPPLAIPAHRVGDPEAKDKTEGGCRGLCLEVQAPTPGERVLELNYLTGGLSWHADYVGRLAADGRTLTLVARATLSNQSGSDYRQARVGLLAGKVHHEEEEYRAYSRRMVLADTAAPAPSRQAIGDHHLYQLADTVDLPDGQVRHLQLFTADQVPVRHQYRVDGEEAYYRRGFGREPQRLKVTSWLLTTNQAENHLGQPLPAGIVRFYAPDQQGRLRFLGADQLPPTPVGEKIRLQLGEAFDLTAHRVQTGFAKLPAPPPYRNLFESSHRLELKNGGQEPKEVVIREPIPGDWKITQASHPHQRPDARHAEWRVQVPAGGTLVLTWTARTGF